MDFNRLLEHFDEDTGQKEQVALAIHYYEEINNQDNITQSKIKDVIRRSRSSVSTSSISTYFTRLEEADWITPTGSGGYRLTPQGRGEVTDRLDENILDNPRNENDHFIDTDVVDGERHKKLINDINDCYRYRIYDGTMVLTRKFFEDVVFQILKTHYAGDNVQMFYDQDNQRHYSFNELLVNLKDGVPTLRRYARELDRELVEDLRELKNDGNMGAHAIRVNFSDEEVEEWADDATKMVEVLYEVLLGARIASNFDE
jgi:DNA-binding PadR family transcriptional regulator